MVRERSGDKPISPQRSQTPRLVFQPDTHRAMQRGINLIADAVRPTLGPLPRLVVVDPVSRGNRQPELMDNGGLIARRILELPDADADMGAMFLRQVLWRQYEEAGDGTATTAVLFQSIYNQGVRYITAGGDAMRLRHHLEMGLRCILGQLERMTIPVGGEELITQLASSICHDDRLAEALGEIFDVIGQDGLLEIRSGRSREIGWDYVQGAYFKGGLHSSSIMASARRTVELTDAAVFISDLDLDDPKQLVQLIALTTAAQKKALVVVVKRISESASGLLTSISRNPERFQAIAVKSPDEVTGQAETLDDLAVLCGGRVFLRAVGDIATGARPSDLGSARRVWADTEYFGIVGGKGSPHGIRNQVEVLRKAREHTQDLHMRKKLRERIGKLMGGAAILQVGGSTDSEIRMRKEKAERTADGLRGALASGILAGGGAALLACRFVLQKQVECAAEQDERIAYQILSRALEEPARILIANAGYEAEPIIRQIRDIGMGFDVRCGRLGDMVTMGVIDSAGVVLSSVREAIASAALALTVDVFVHHRKPEVSVNP